MHAKNSHQDMLSYLESMEIRMEFEDVKDVPPLDIILYRGMRNLHDLLFVLRLMFAT